MPVAWHPDRWWDRCKSEEIDPMFIEELWKCVLIVYFYEGKNCTKIYTRKCLKQFSSCYIMQTNSVLITFVNYILRNIKTVSHICLKSVLILSIPK